MITYLLFKNGKYLMQELDGRKSDFFAFYTSARGVKYSCWFSRIKRGSNIARQIGKPTRVIHTRFKDSKNASTTEQSAPTATIEGVSSEGRLALSAECGVQTKIEFSEQPCTTPHGSGVEGTVNRTTEGADGTASSSSSLQPIEQEPELIKLSLGDLEAEKKKLAAALDNINKDNHGL